MLPGSTWNCQYTEELNGSNLVLETVAEDQVFSVYLGNIPVDVILEDIWTNGKQLKMSEKLGYSLRHVVHSNGSKAYELRLPFEDSVVQQMVRIGCYSCKPLVTAVISSSMKLKGHFSATFFSFFELKVSAWLG